MSKPFPKFNTRGLRTLGGGLQSHANLGQGLNIDFQDRFRFHDELVADRGEMLIHEMAVACPSCRRGDSDDPIFFTAHCSNDCEWNGFMYRNPRYIQALVTGISQSRDLGEFGFASPGDCTISPAPNLRPQIHEYDRITFTWPQTVDEGQVLVRGNEYRRFKERGGTHTLEENEDLLFYSAANALHVEDEDGNEYFEDADFVFDGKIIRWLGNKPIIRKRYVVKYEAYFEWIAITPPLERRDKGRNLGPRIFLRKVHAFKSADDPNQDTAEERADNNLFSNKVVV